MRLNIKLFQYFQTKAFKRIYVINHILYRASHSIFHLQFIKHLNPLTPILFCSTLKQKIHRFSYKRLFHCALDK